MSTSQSVPLKVGLTGGIASGKSAVSEQFKRLKIEIIDADQIARDLFKPDSPLLNDLRNRFGNDIFNTRGELDRKALGNIVFNSPPDLNWLNQLTHPKVRDEIAAQLSMVKSPYVILDIPLLVDKSGEIPPHLAQVVDRVLVVDVEPTLQVKRLYSRDNLDEQAALAIIKNQSSRRQKLAKADDVIDNNGDWAALESQVKVLHNHYLSMTKSNME